MRRTRLLVVVLLAGLALAGCGDSASPEEIVVGSVDKTVAAGTARIRQRIDMDGGAPVGTITAKGVTDLGELRTSLTMEVQGQEIDVVVDGETMYERFPALEEQFGTPWILIDLAAAGDALGTDLGGLSQTGADPIAATAFLRGAQKVKEIGKARVRGEDVTHYGAVVDYERAADAAPSKAQAKVLRQSAEALGVERQPVDVWIDGDGRVRKLEQEIDLSEARRPEGVDESQAPDAMTITVELYDFGTDVDIDIPDEDEVTDVSHLLGAEPGEGSGTATPETDALEPLLLSEVPEGFVAQPDDVGDTGPSDLAKAVRDEQDEDARRLLTEGGFVAGYQRLWSDDDGGQLVAFLYRFEAPEGAAAYTAHTARLYDGADVPPTTTEPVTRFEPVEVSGVPGARAWRTDDFAVVLFARDGFAVQLVMDGPRAEVATLAELARQQYDLLVSDGA